MCASSCAPAASIFLCHPEVRLGPPTHQCNQSLGKKKKTPTSSAMQIGILGCCCDSGKVARKRHRQAQHSWSLCRGHVQRKPGRTTVSYLGVMATALQSPLPASLPHLAPAGRHPGSAGFESGPQMSKDIPHPVPAG